MDFMKSSVTRLINASMRMIFFCGAEKAEKIDKYDFFVSAPDSLVFGRTSQSGQNRFNFIDDNCMENFVLAEMDDGIKTN